MIYRVYSCFDEMSLSQYCREELRIDTWIPLERRERITKDGDRVTSVVCVMPGYIFVPIQKDSSFRRGISERFNAKVMQEFYGDPTMKRDDRQFFMRPVSVTWEELALMQETINGDLPRLFNVGDRVVGLGPYEEQFGVIVKLLKDDRVTVKIGEKYHKLLQTFWRKL